jgi:hypothetical protein
LLQVKRRNGQRPFGVSPAEGGITSKIRGEDHMRKIMLLVVGCAAPVYGQNAATDFRTAAGCGPQKMPYEVTWNPPDKGVMAPSAGKARIYVIEIVGTNTTGVTTRVGVDGNWMGANTGQGYISFDLDPGEHNICADWQSILKVRQQDGGAMVMKAESLTEVEEAEGQWLLSISQKSAWKKK